MLPASALVFAVTIAVDRVPLHAGIAPLLERGRVLVPLRALFTALGADVVYDAPKRTIRLRRGSHEARVTLGSRFATVDGKTVTLDVAARTVHERTYIPLRFAGEALGARVTYDAATRSVAITTHAETALAARPPTVEFRRPAPGETVTGGFVSISAALETHGGPPIDQSTVRMFVDERDVTDRIWHSGDAVAYTPAREVAAGSHEVTVQGADQAGTRFTSNWDFQSVYAAPSGSSYLGPSFGGFYVSGPLAYYSSGTISMYLAAPPGGYGYVNLCGYAAQYPFAYGPVANRYIVNVPIPLNLYAPACYVSGFFFDASGNRSYVALQTPVLINTVVTNAHVITIHPSPSPSPAATPHHAAPIIHIHASPTPHPSKRPTPKPTP